MVDITNHGRSEGEITDPDGRTSTPLGLTLQPTELQPRPASVARHGLTVPGPRPFDRRWLMRRLKRLEHWSTCACDKLTCAYPDCPKGGQHAGHL